MRLIRCSDYALVHRERGDIPKYLILCHTWGHEEVTFSDMTNVELAKEKKGWKKIEGICEMARMGIWPQVYYAWVDTCCIDKSSSTELAESINSMFAYYRDSFACVAYLEDLETMEGVATEEELKGCKWFSRGWTLQELIAPNSIRFFDRTWIPRGDKGELVEVLAKITGISKEVLGKQRPLDEVSVAQKMSWAAGRKTRRFEDRAYSLLGIFGVNMPLLYGEGNGAFRRLQETIAQHVNDLSIFAWKTRPEPLCPRRCGVLAENPECFAEAGGIELMNDPGIPTPSFSITNAGVQLETSLGLLLDAASATTRGDCLLHLHCKMSIGNMDGLDVWHSNPQVVFLPLVRTPLGLVRPSGSSLLVCRQSSVRFQDVGPVVMAKSVSDNFLNWAVLTNLIRVRCSRVPSGLRLAVNCYPTHLWLPDHSVFQIHAEMFFVGVVEVELRHDVDEKPVLCWIVCGKRCTKGRRVESFFEQLWGTVFTEDMLGSLPEVGVYSRNDFHNPLAISNMGHRLRSIRHDGLALPSKQKIQVNGYPYEISLLTRQDVGKYDWVGEDLVEFSVDVGS